MVPLPGPMPKDCTELSAICSSVVMPMLSSFFRSEGMTPSNVRASSIGYLSVEPALNDLLN